MTITIKRATKTVDLCTNLELQAEYETAVEALNKARESKVVGMEVGNVAERAAAKRIKELEAPMEASTLTFTLTAVPKKKFAEFEASNPPREDNDQDAQYGLDISKLDGLIEKCITNVVNKVTGEREDFDPATEWVPLADDMSTGQWREFQYAVLMVNRGVTSAPFSRSASLVMSRSEQS